MYYSAGFGYAATAAFWLALLIKVLFAVFVISLIIALGVWIKNNFFTTEDIATLKSSINKGGTRVSTEKCSYCGKELNSEWVACPHCGEEKIATAQ